MGIGHPREIYRRMGLFYRQVARYATLEVLSVGRRRARFRWTPHPGCRIPTWACPWLKVSLERFPTNWGLPRARIVEPQCAAKGADSCVYEVAWKNPPLGRRFWIPVIAGAAGSLPPSPRRDAALSRRAPPLSATPPRLRAGTVRDPLPRPPP